MSVLVKTNLRAYKNDQLRSSRSVCDGRDGFRFGSNERTLQDPHRQASKRILRTRTQTSVRHIGSVRPPEAAGLRRLRCILESTGQRSPVGRSFLWKDAYGLLGHAQNIQKA